MINNDFGKRTIEFTFFILKSVLYFSEFYESLTISSQYLFDILTFQLLTFNCLTNTHTKLDPIMALQWNFNIKNKNKNKTYPPHYYEKVLKNKT